jgi:hypothetical protein
MRYIAHISLCIFSLCLSNMLMAEQTAVDSLDSKEATPVPPVIGHSTDVFKKDDIEISGADILQGAIESLEEIDISNFAAQDSKLLKRSSINKIIVYRISGNRDSLLDRDDYLLLEHLLINKVKNLYQVIECIECNSRKITVYFDRLSQHSKLGTYEHAQELANSLGVDGILFWGINLMRPSMGIYFRLMEIATGKTIFTKKDLIKDIASNPYLQTDWWSIHLKAHRVAFDATKGEDASKNYTTNIPFIGMSREWDIIDYGVSVRVGADYLVVAPPFCDAVRCSAAATDAQAAILSNVTVYRLEAGIKNYYGPIHPYLSLGAISLDFVSLTSAVGFYTDFGIIFQHSASGFSFNLNYLSFLSPIEMSYSSDQVSIINSGQIGMGVQYRW